MVGSKNLAIETRHPTMMNLLKAKQGAILFDGASVEKMLDKVFYYESIEWLDKNLSGMDYLKFVKQSWKSDIEIADVLTYWEMDEYIKLPIKKYSLGMKQRLVIGMYMISNAKYMIMDEITSGLDEDNRKRFFHQIHDLKVQGKTILPKLSSFYIPL